MINWIVKVLGWRKALTFKRNFAISVKLHEFEGQVLDIRFDPFWGFFEILLDGKAIAKELQFFAKPLLRIYEHELSCNSIVRVEQERPSTWDGVNEKEYRVFVNGNIIVNVQGF